MNKWALQRQADKLLEIYNAQILCNTIGCSSVIPYSTEFKLWNDFVAEYLDRELVQLGIGGVGNPIYCSTFMNKIKELLDDDVPLKIYLE